MHRNVQTPQPLRDRHVHRRGLNRFGSSVPFKAPRLRMAAEMRKVCFHYSAMYISFNGLFISRFYIANPSRRTDQTFDHLLVHNGQHGSATSRNVTPSGSTKVIGYLRRATCGNSVPSVTPASFFPSMGSPSSTSPFDTGKHAKVLRRLKTHDSLKTTHAVPNDSDMLSDKVAIVTGSSSGIGRAIAFAAQLNSIRGLVLAIYSCIIGFLFSASLMINTWDFTTEGLCRAAMDICLWRGPPKRTISIPAYRPIPQGLQSADGPYRPLSEQPRCHTRLHEHLARIIIMVAHLITNSSSKTMWNGTPAKSRSSQGPSIDSVFLKGLKVASNSDE